MILPLESRDLSLLDNYPVGATSLFVWETTIPLDYSDLLNNCALISLLQMHLLDCDSTSIQPPLHHLRPSNMLNSLHTSASYGRILHMPKRKFQCSMAPSLNRLGMATNNPSSAYKPLHEYQILRVSNSPHLCELCITLLVVAQLIPPCMVSFLPSASLA